jgi:hypothetical protein
MSAICDGPVGSRFLSQPLSCSVPPLVSSPNPAAGNARSALRFAFERQRPGVPEPGRSALSPIL